MRRSLWGIVFTCLSVCLGPLSVWADEPEGEWIDSFEQAPPELTNATTGRFFPNVTLNDLSALQVQFSVPVEGVRAEDLTVNGSRAKEVVGEGAGPYLFTGYVVPGPGAMKIKLAPGQIRRKGNLIPFKGFSWGVQAFDASKDDDGDGLTNSQEIEVYSDPTSPDTDGDGIPDPYEMAHPCLKFYLNESVPQGDDKALPTEDDADHDGVSNLDEYKKGTDPCSADETARH